MKYYIVSYITRDGEHEYTEEGIFQAEEGEIEEKAEGGNKAFTRFGWEEFCEQSGCREVPEADYMVLVKYMSNIDTLLEWNRRLEYG